MIDYPAYYIVIDPKTNKFFDVQIKEWRIAQQYCNFLSNRDQVKYIIRRMYMTLGIPEYKDKEIKEALKIG